jgi:iron complex outermembrane receptor protein
MYKLCLCGLALAGPLYAQEAAQEIVLDEVLVSAPVLQTLEEPAQPATVLSAEELRGKAARSIGETLKQEPGISSQSFGPGVGSPVIRGQAGPRVRVLQNGLGANDVSNLSPDHANSVEPILAQRIEILRGPATLRYGSGAIGGVVNVIDERIPSQAPERLFNFAGEQRYDSAADENASVLNMEGSQAGLAYHLDGFYRARGNAQIGGTAIDEDAARATEPSLAQLPSLRNTRGFIDHTQAHAIGGTAGLSYIGAAGFAGAAINRLENTYGIPQDGSGGAPTRIDMRQTRYDFRSEWRQPFAFAEALRLKWGYTDYQHLELEGGLPSTRWLNQTYESRMELAHRPWGAWRGMLGFQSSHSDFAAVGAEAIVPQSQIDSYGLFALESLAVGPIAYELGARVEHQAIDPRGFKARGDLPVSGSAAAVWTISDEQQLSLALTQSQRAPQVQELYSNGPHRATRSFDIGDPHLKKEIAYNLELGYRYRKHGAQAEFNVFHSWASDYIYLSRTGELGVRDGESLPIQRSRQNDAIFKGFESKLSLPVVESHYGLLDVSLFGDYTRGEFVHGGDVPRMPPLRYGFQLDYSKARWSASLRLTRGEAQDRPGAHEAKTAAYLLLGLGAQYQLKTGERSQIILFAKANNLLDENIRNAASYLRNFAPEPGRGAEVGVRVSY